MTLRSLIAPMLFLVTLAILLALGFWQLIRGLDKAEINNRVIQGQQSVVHISNAKDDWSNLTYSMATLEGNWREDKTFLLANRLLKGQPGHEVLTPFVLEDGSWMLVNRGWRSQQAFNGGNLPAIRSEQQPKGQLYLPAKGFTLGETWNGEITWPLEILYYDFPALSYALEQKLAPMVLVLDQQHPDSFVTIWRPTTIAPERHYAYVAQWWGLALTLIIFGLIWRRKSYLSEP